MTIQPLLLLTCGETNSSLGQIQLFHPAKATQELKPLPRKQSPWSPGELLLIVSETMAECSYHLPWLIQVVNFPQFILQSLAPSDEDSEHLN